MKLAVWIVLAFLARGSAHGQEPATAGLAERVDAIAQTALARPLAGISIAVAREGRVVFARGYGLANVEHAVPVAPETVFHVASISKNILAGVILQLADQGRLRLDEDVTKYVPEAPTQGRRVTVRQLLSHTSGIYSFTSLPDAEENESRHLTHEQVLALFRARAVARVVLGLPATPSTPVRDLPVPREELDAIAGGTYDSDEGGVAVWNAGGKLRYRLVGRPIEGELTRQGPWAYAAEGGSDIRFKVRGGRAEWTLVYSGGLLMDAKRRVR